MTALLNETRPPKARKFAGRTRALRFGNGAALISEGASVMPPTSAVLSPGQLLARQVVRDGETILLIIKPSRWFIVLSCFRFIATVSIILCALHLSRLPQNNMRYYVDAGAFTCACRLMWATLGWMGRLYVLTDQRILRFAGVFQLEVFDCPLRKVARTNLVRAFSERLLRIGSIEIYPAEATRMPCAWQMVAKPRLVQERIEMAIRKTSQGGCGGFPG